MNCPQCQDNDIHGFLHDADQLWMEFEAEVIDNYLHTVFYCRRCDFTQEKKFDPELIHLHVQRGLVVTATEIEEDDGK